MNDKYLVSGIFSSYLEEGAFSFFNDVINYSLTNIKDIKKYENDYIKKTNDCIECIVTNIVRLPGIKE